MIVVDDGYLIKQSKVYALWQVTGTLSNTLLSMNTKSVIKLFEKKKVTYTSCPLLRVYHISPPLIFPKHSWTVSPPHPRRAARSTETSARHRKQPRPPTQSLQPSRLDYNSQHAAGTARVTWASGNPGRRAVGEVAAEAEANAKAKPARRQRIRAE